MDKEKISHVAKLAHLELTSKEVDEFSLQLSKALEYFEQLSAVPTDGVEPLVTPSEMKELLREDIAKVEGEKEISTETLLSNAPHKTGNLFTVPPVV
jgi:aspartyl-tRNA(Asn)/glutamyl-tRNA(Gln) amidotransferase subunit C